MFEIEKRGANVVAMMGRLDAAQVNKAEELLQTMEGAIQLDLAALDYISSAGISVILRLHKRLNDQGLGLTLVNATPHVRNVFHYAGLDQVLKIE